MERLIFQQIHAQGFYRVTEFMNQNVFIAVAGLILAFQYSYYVFLSNGGNSVVVFISAVALYFIHIRIPGVPVLRNEVGIFIRTVERHGSAVFCHSGRNACLGFSKHMINLISSSFQARSLYIITGFYNDAGLGCVELSVVIFIIHVIDSMFRSVAVFILNRISVHDFQSNRFRFVHRAFKADAAESIAVKIHGVPVAGEKLKFIVTVFQDIVVRINRILNFLVPADLQIVALFQNPDIRDLWSIFARAGHSCVRGTGQSGGDCKRTCRNQRKMFSFSAHFSSHLLILCFLIIENLSA